MTLYVGLMSGTSVDGIDAVLVDWPNDLDRDLQIRGHVHQTYASALRDELLALNGEGDNELHRGALAANALALAYAQTLRRLLQQCGLAPTQVGAAGAHGQTVRHRPSGDATERYTIQLLNGALLAELGGIDVVCDFRSRDLAAGGQGAPLVPAFHAARFAKPGARQAVLNLGGIGNLTLLDADGSVGGFDCGPGNLLMDLWAQQHRGALLDDGGRWAATGAVDPALLCRMLNHPFFDAAPPKSTGRDLFNRAWLESMLGSASTSPVDVQATLAELTSRSASDALRRYLPNVQTLYVCGGGAFNAHVMARLVALLPAASVQTTAPVGLPVDQVEAVAFAWLARAFMHRRPGNRVEVTGAAGPRILGALHPAR